MWIFVLLVGAPIVEIVLFIKLGGWLGLWPTIGLVIATAVLGAALLRTQGFGALTTLRRQMSHGGDLGGPLAHGAMILIAGALMLTPGFFTDAMGFALLIPPVRAALIARIGPWLAARATVHMRRNADRNGAGAVDADYIDISDTTGGNAPTRSHSGWRRPSK